MAVNKNFVVRNGLEVNTDLIIADADLGKVGIGSTVPRFELDVAGGIGATDVYISGVATFISNIKVGSDGSVLSVVGAARSVGVGTEIPAYLLDVRSPVSTGQTSLYVKGDVQITGDLSVDDIISRTVQISSGIITATSGIVTYYGDGSKLTNILSGVGISSLGVFIGAGATIINFVGTAVSTVTVSSGIATIKLDASVGGGGGGTPGGSSGQVQYNNSGVFAGSSNFTFDGSNVNIAGVVTATTFSGTATEFTVTANNSTNETVYPVFVDGATGSQGAETDTSLSYNPSTNVLIAGIFSGSGASLTSLNAGNISSGTLAIANGGTNATATPTAGGAAYGTGTAYAFTLAGTSGQVLTSNGTSAPTWSTATYPTTTTANRILYSSATNTIGQITSANTSALVSNSTGVPSFASGTTANRVLRTDGTTVSFAQANLTTDVTGTLPIANGGTNATATPTAGGAAYGTGTAYAFTLAGTSGQVLTSNGTSAPTWQDASGGIEIVDDTSTNATRYVPFVSSISGSVGIASVSSSKLQFNPSTGNLSATQFTSLSDASQKTNIRTIENPIEITKQLHGVRFDWIDNKKPSLGLIAQEVEEVLPELIETGDDGLKRVNYSNMIGLLIETVKEQQVRIEELERRLNA